MADKAELVVSYARSRGGLFTTKEAETLGMSRSSIARWARRGLFERVGRGVFALVGSETDLVLLEGACRRLSAVVSHQSAARLHGFALDGYTKPSVIVPHRATHEFLGVVVHQTTDLTDEQVVEIRGLPVTSPERTIVDLAAVLSEKRIDWVLDRALASGSVDLERLAALFSTLARRGKPGTARLRHLIELREGWAQPPDSELESRLWSLIAGSGLPEPTRQFQAPWLSATNGRVDFAYPEQKLVIEGDSRRWHLLVRSFDTDRERDNLAQLAGWRILRFTWEDITNSPEYVVTTIRRALAG